MAIMRVTRPPDNGAHGGHAVPTRGPATPAAGGSGTPRLQIPQPDQGIGGGGEGELPIHQGDAAMPELAQAADGLHPAEDLFHEFSFPLTHVIARMPRGPTVDRTPADLLRHVGRDVLLATSRTGTLESELNELPPGFSFVGMTVFNSRFGGDETAAILEAVITE